MQDLQNPDVDKALAPHWRVQQRGIKATQDIIMKMLEGMNECDGQKVLIVDLNPSRFCEWSQAAWEMQRDYLLGEEGGNKWDIHFMGVYHDSDGHWMDANKDLITGRALSQWWDKSDEAGPAARISEPFALECPTLECLAISDGGVKVPDMVQQKFTATHHEPLKKIEEKISQDASVQKAIQMTESGSSSAGPTQSRTMGSPQWENETPLNWRKTLSLAGISVADFDSSNTPEAATTITREPNLEIVLTSLGSMWVVNRTPNKIDLAPGELFGFNTGVYAEINSDQHASQTANIPWHVTDDRTLVCLVGSEKKIMTIADAVCDVARTRGVPEIRMVDHGMTAKMKVNADGSQTPMCYRYVIQAAPKINAFKPRELASTDDRLHLRAAQFGALWCGKLHQLPKATHCTVIWEVKIGESIPCNLTPLKPKFFLLGALSVAASSAVKLK